MAKAYLQLANGKVFEGESFGAIGDVTGEVVFTTSMIGYLEALTDPSYHGQIVVQTFPLIGNYGVIPEDFESGKIGPKGYIVKYPCEEPSNFRDQGKLEAFLKKNNVIGLKGVDTREITKIIRNSGVMNGRIVSKIDDELEGIKDFVIENAVESVQGEFKYNEKSNGKKVIALMDFGAKKSTVYELEKRGFQVVVLKGNATAEEVIATSPEGIMLSDGPGDPAENIGIIKEIAKLIKSDVPIFGICLGHQLLALAHDFKTMKLKYGHRGANQPVKNLMDGKTYISSQNHGYAVDMSSVERDVAEELFVNVNDGTNEGLIYKNKPIFSVQFYPESCCGPLDSNFLFEMFIKNIEKHGREKK